MSTALDHKIIVYDDVCPLCQAYTSSFVRLGWLKQRTGFATATPEILQRLDLDRARHEIPLHDLQTGETLYGLDALFLILGERFPFLRPLFRFRPFRPALYFLYQIITFNRRIIAGSRPPAQGFDCAPDLNRFYRWLYVGLALAASAALLRPGFAAPTGFFIATLLLHGIALAAVFFAGKRLDFVGHWATVLLVNCLVISIVPANIMVQMGALVLTGWMWLRRWPLVK